jgi:hypothetical protein
MHTSTQLDITVDPELAVLHILDVAAGIAASLLMVFHPSVCDPASRLDRGHILANRIIEQAHHLRRALLDYREHLDFENGPPQPIPW